MVHSMSLHVIVQWINFLVIAVLVGTVGFRSAVLDFGIRILDSGSPDRETVQSASRRELEKWIFKCLIVLTVVSLLDIYLRAQMMSMKPFSQVFGVLPLVLSKTHIGKMWQGKMAFLLFFWILWVFIKWKPRTGQPLLLFACAGLCLTTSLSGHSADKGDFSLSLLADWFHVMAISIWSGGLVQLRFLMPKILAKIDKKNVTKLQAIVIPRFSSLAVICVIILIITGVYNAYIHLKTWSALLGSAYGITLTFKLAFVVPMLVLGALGRYYIRPLLQTQTGVTVRESTIARLAKQIICLLGGDTGSEEHRALERGFGSVRIAMFHFQVFVALQCIFWVGVMGVTALLTQTSPPKAVDVSISRSHDSSSRILLDKRWNQDDFADAGAEQKLTRCVLKS